jgi:hypothetical protein
VPELGRQASASSDSSEPGSGDPGEGPQGDWPDGTDGTPLSPEHQAWLNDEANIWPDDGQWNWPAGDETSQDDPVSGASSPGAAWPSAPTPAIRSHMTWRRNPPHPPSRLIQCRLQMSPPPMASPRMASPRTGSP